MAGHQEIRRTPTQTKKAQRHYGIKQVLRRSKRILAIQQRSKSWASTKQKVQDSMKQKNLSNFQFQKQAVKPAQHTRTPENPTSTELPRESLGHTQNSPQSRFLDQVERRGRLREKDTLVHPSHKPFPKQARKFANRTELQKTTDKNMNNSWQKSIYHWATEKTWPKEYFEDDKMYHLLAKKKGLGIRDKSESILPSGTPGPSDERPREEKSAPYRSPNYPNILSEDVRSYKSYMRDHELGISDASKKLLDKLLYTKQSPPQNTLFCNEVFDKHLQKLKGKNESRILQDLSPLLVPSAEAFASLGAKHLEVIVESVNEGWNNCYPITKPRPQPDGAFGYGRSAFSNSQLDKLQPTLGDTSFLSYFKATHYMLFPFLTKEVTASTMGFDIPDNQNLHSATIAVRAVVELFKIVGREKELHQEIVSLTISHDDQSIRLYAHYPIIDDDEVTIWRHTIDQYYLTPTTKWSAWAFTKNVLDIFSTVHLKRIRSAIDDIPSAQIFLSQQSELRNTEHRASP